MGRNPNDIETYLKEFDVQNIIEANNKSLMLGQPKFIELRKQMKLQEQEKIKERLKEQGNLELLEQFKSFQSLHQIINSFL